MAGENLRGKGQSITLGQAHKMTDMYETGKSIGEIAEACGVSDRMASNVIKRSMAERGMPCPDFRVKLTDSQKRNMADEYYSSRITTSELAERYGVSQQYVSALVSRKRHLEGGSDGDHSRIQKTNQGPGSR